jgi:co-chaperonin GroES (HSP10)
VNATPLRDRVLVLLSALDTPSEGAIQLVRLERTPTTRAVVVACGDEVRDVRAGQRVVISRLQGVEVGAELLLLPESAVLATESEPADVSIDDVRWTPSGGEA